MKKIVVIIVVFFVFQVGKAQNEKMTQELQKFTAVKGFDGLAITLIKSDVNKAVITGTNTKKVAIVNNKGVLKIRMELDKIFSGYRTFINLYYTEELTEIDVNEDAKFTSKEVFEQDKITLKAQEGGEIQLNTQVKDIVIKAITGGVVAANGKAASQDVTISTGGIYKGEDLHSKVTTINVNAGGTGTIYATDYVKATVKAGGTVEVYGDPTKMDEKTVFGGKIKRM